MKGIQLGGDSFYLRKGVLTKIQVWRLIIYQEAKRSMFIMISLYLCVIFLFCKRWPGGKLFMKFRAIRTIFSWRLSLEDRALFF